MAEIKRAIKWLRRNKKVRRPCWKEGSYWTLGTDESIIWNNKSEAIIHLSQLEADDYEIFEEFDVIKVINNTFEGLDENWITKKTVEKIMKKFKEFNNENKTNKTNRR